MKTTVLALAWVAAMALCGCAWQLGFVKHLEAREKALAGDLERLTHACDAAIDACAKRRESPCAELESCISGVKGEQDRLRGAVQDLEAGWRLLR
jgi:hypothetical protein